MSLTQYSRSQPRLYLGKSEDGIHSAAAAFGIGITLSIKMRAV